MQANRGDSKPARNPYQILKDRDQHTCEKFLHAGEASGYPAGWERVQNPANLLTCFMEADPDYKRPSTLSREVEAAGFHFKNTVGNFFVYSMLFNKNGQ